MTLHGHHTISTTQGILAGTLAVAAGFAAGKFTGHMDPALKALNDYAEAAASLGGVGFTQEEGTENINNLQGLYQLYKNHLESYNNGEDIDQEVDAKMIKTLLDLLMENVSKAKERGGQLARPAKRAKSTYTQGDTNEAKTIDGSGAAGSSGMDAEDMSDAAAIEAELAKKKKDEEVAAAGTSPTGANLLQTGLPQPVKRKMHGNSRQ